MDVLLFQAVAEVLDAGAERTVVDGVSHLDDEAADERLVHLGNQDRLGGQGGRQPLFDTTEL
jgi:hypothetical protein